MSKEKPITERVRQINEIIRSEGIASPKLPQIGHDHSGEGRGDGPNGEPNKGRHIPAGGFLEEKPHRDEAGSETDPDAPDDATPRRDRPKGEGR